ncbi:hypothetical protein C8J57DRAFT_1525564 [Mycena rebaudengoi]|nr:hypothetical protein C8J57DRAFT_1525564 [Mycena rebaudengoi]
MEQELDSTHLALLLPPSPPSPSATNSGPCLAICNVHILVSHARILFTNGTEEQVSCGGLQVVGVGGPRSSLAARASLDVQVEHREAVALLLLVLVPAFMVVGAVAAVDAAIDADMRRAFGSSGTGWYRHSQS